MTRGLRTQPYRLEFNKVILTTLYMSQHRCLSNTGLTNTFRCVECTRRVHNGILLPKSFDSSQCGYEPIYKALPWVETKRTSCVERGSYACKSYNVADKSAKASAWI